MGFGEYDRALDSAKQGIGKFAASGGVKIVKIGRFENRCRRE